MTRYVAIDPGGVHVGWAVFEDGVCKWVHEVSPMQCLYNLDICAETLDAIVVESFHLYPSMAQTLTGSDMATSRLIGAIQYLAIRAGTPVVMQPASIKKPTESVLRHRGVVLQSHGEGNHAKDAEIHGYCYAIRGTDPDPRPFA